MLPEENLSKALNPIYLTANQGQGHPAFDTSKTTHDHMKAT